MDEKLFKDENLDDKWKWMNFLNECWQHMKCEFFEWFFGFGLVTIGKIKEPFEEFTLNLCFFHKTHKIFGNFETPKTKGHTKSKN